jgi:hypothetical protein
VFGFDGFFREQLRRSIKVEPVGETEFLRQQEAMLKYFFKIKNPELLSDNEFYENWEQLVWVRKYLAKSSMLPLDLQNAPDDY